MKKETWHWTRPGELSEQITHLVEFVSKIAKTTDDVFGEQFYSGPLLLDICADSEEDIFIKIIDNYDENMDDDDIDCNYVLFTSYGTPCADYSKAIPKKYIKKVKDLLFESICFMHYLANPCCKKAKENARRVFVGTKANDITCCPWCQKLCLDEESWQKCLPGLKNGRTSVNVRAVKLA